jgi:lipid II isoglutaminyl synthase (glutamine-hydrolysing)
MTSAVQVCLVYPELLGTYGDGGNAVVLAQRLRWRDIAADVVAVSVDEPLPLQCDLYVVGGGEDAPQTLATNRLTADGLGRAVDAGAAVLAVCAGLQVLSNTYTAADGSTVPGLGLLDCTTRPRGSRMIGELVVDATAFDLPRLTGFENHGGITSLGVSAIPLGRVVTGFGNGTGGVEGAVSGKVIGTYLHGPVLARNPALADRLLSWVVGDAAFAPLDDSIIDRLRAERLAAARSGRSLVRTWSWRRR